MGETMNFLFSGNIRFQNQGRKQAVCSDAQYCPNAIDFPMRETALYIFCKGNHVLTVFRLQTYTCSLFEQIRRPNFPFLLGLKFLVCWRQLNKIAEQTTD